MNVGVDGCRREVAGNKKYAHITYKKTYDH